MCAYLFPSHPKSQTHVMCIRTDSFTSFHISLALYDTRSMINSFWLVEPFGVEMYGTHKNNFSVECGETPPLYIHVCIAVLKREYTFQMKYLLNVWFFYIAYFVEFIIGCIATEFEYRNIYLGVVKFVWRHSLTDIISTQTQLNRIWVNVSLLFIIRNCKIYLKAIWTFIYKFFYDEWNCSHPQAWVMLGL